MSKRDTSVRVSAIVVFGERQDDTASIIRDYWRALEEHGGSFEFICVLDGRRERALAALETLRSEGLNLRIVRLAKAFGEATALMSGFDVSSGSLILTLPAYYQVDPGENYGWPHKEGMDCFQTSPCTDPEWIDPIGHLGPGLSNLEGYVFYATRR